MFLIVMLTILLRKFFKRLLKISLIADEVAEGNLLSSLPESSDELGRINITFNKMMDNLKSIIMQIKNVSEVVIESSNSYKNISLEVVECGKEIKQSIENLTLGAKNTAEEIQNITISINDMENKSKELVNINEAVSNTSAISEESVASTICFEDIINKQESIFTNLEGASEHLDEL